MIDKLKLLGEINFEDEMKNYTTYKTGGLIKYLFRNNSINNLVSSIKLLEEENIKYFLLGNGTNIIFQDNYFNGVVIKLDKLNNYEIDEENLILNAEAGVYLPYLSSKLSKMGYSAFEFAAGLPGCIGSSIYGNAEAYKVPISESLIDVTVLKNNKIETLKKEEIKFGYRTSEFKENKDSIILSARFKLRKENPDILLDKIKQRTKRRLDTQPLEYPSAGSTFRNPHKKDYEEIFKKYNLPVNESGYVPAGYLIENANLKGYSIGGAKVSEKHANFIINYENASSSDIIKLIDYIKEKVKEKYEIDLILEQEIINL